MIGQISMDTANYIIWYYQYHKIPILNLRLQRIFYRIYIQYLERYQEPFDDAIFIKWAYGPTAISLYYHFSFYQSNPINKDISIPPQLPDKLQKIVNNVLSSTKDLSLATLVHQDTVKNPDWLNAKMNTEVHYNFFNN